ncbi:GNAT family N-acetyltransferase [Ornithinimicrobium pratense]|uniref:GNAT family N-acetyltransferase n=1 Tax=Ornithinimicrobium pratense TaxID=2593973 RepID=A0A5J6V2N3_9MICO|nr:GNAT family N-acetyltransferase [Ornithinimicrobium pratense]QFG68129.1 GNAT family N-acetyltransferase [Ornithinimicrobium pratense]
MPSADAPVTVIPVSQKDWESYRDLRLEMLLDAPEAFWSQHSQVVDRTEEQWRQAAGGMPSLQARDAQGTALGTLTVAPRGPGPESEKDPSHGPGDVMVLAVYVRPRARGRGVGDQLLRAAEQLAVEQFDAQRLLLHVSELNEPARALYARHGYRPTGQTIDHPRLAGVKELELAKPLR